MIAGHRARRITRLSTPPSCEGIRAPTLDALLAALTHRGVVSPVFADLSIGAFRSHEVARSCFCQLGLDGAWPLPEAPAGDARRLHSVWIDSAHDAGEAEQREAESQIGDWIDAEGRGDTITLQSLALAEALLAQLDAPAPHSARGRPLALVVLAPRFAASSAPAFRAEDTAFLRCLLHGTRVGDRVILVSTGEAIPVLDGVEIQWSDAPPALPRPRPPDIGALVPGVVDADTVAALGIEGHPLAAGWRLIAPEWRQPLDLRSRLEHDRLAASPVASGLRAFAQLRGNNHFVDPWFLCTEATRRLAEGGQGLALDLLQRAAACARTPEDRAALQSLAQGFRIALMRYDEAAAVADPSRALPPDLRGALLMTKGWGLAMSGRAVEADPYLCEARELLRPRFGSRLQYLYLLNIHALVTANLGDFDGAMALERQIEGACDALPERDARLDYVNAINMARLHRRLGQPDHASRRYARAFACTAGVRTESDLIYVNVCAARLDAAREGASAATAALSAWLRAALHWLSASAPEAIGWRVLSAIVGRRAAPSQTAFSEVADALADHLRAAADRAGADAASPAGELPVFAQAGDDPLGAGQAFGAPGWSVIAVPWSEPRAVDGPAASRLASLVHSLLSAAAPGLARATTLLVDDGLGCEMAVERHELIDTCVRLHVPRAQIGGERIELGPVEREAIEDRSLVRLGAAVASIGTAAAPGAGEPRVVRFRRYRAPYRLSGVEEIIVDACCDGSATIAELCARLGAPRAEVVEVARRLECKRVVEIRSASACSTCFDRKLLLPWRP